MVIGVSRDWSSGGRAILGYQNGTITISEDIEFSMRQTVRQITHYILSKYIGGQTDEIGRRKPSAILAMPSLTWSGAPRTSTARASRHATDGDFIFSLVVQKELQQWMKTNNFGKTIDDYQRKKSEYGSVLMKKTETTDELKIEPVKWEYTSVDPKDIACGPKVERNDMSILELMKKADVWDELQPDSKDGKTALEAAIAAAKRRKERNVEILDVEAELDDSIFEQVPDEEDTTISLYNVIVAQVGGKKYLLYKVMLKESRFKHDKRNEVEGRDMGVGVWEEVIEPTNEAVIGEKFAMDLGVKLSSRPIRQACSFGPTMAGVDQSANRSQR
jgi:hypothetical protein